MRWAVVVFPASNCDDDAVKGITTATGDEAVKVWHQETNLDDFDAIVLPGGFSYGDYLRSGAIARFSPVMSAVRTAADQGKLILGICNGFQVLTESRLLPGALLRNSHLQFRCEMAPLRVMNTNSPFTRLFQPGDEIHIPIAHGEGRFFADETQLDELRRDGRIAFEYLNNPNGSVANIAGIVNSRGNVLGMMPHPERAVAHWMNSSDGEKIFQSMHQFVEEGVVIG